MNREQSRITMIEERLNRAFSPSHLQIIDDSHKHAGHASAGGAGHFTVIIHATAFEGKTAIQRHRMVFSALEDIMNSEIHALSIQADTPK